VTLPKISPCNCEDLPCMGIPRNSHETAIFELGIPQIHRFQRREFPPREFLVVVQININSSLIY